ncbi:MAG: hypothetical protein ACRBN8_45575 [Nannocystales bacterium]
MSDERSSKLGDEAPFIEPDEEARAKLEAENGLRQYDRLVELIDAGLGRRFRLRPSQMMELNRIAVAGLISHPGALRHGEISISGTDHVPPAPTEVAEFVDEMCDYVNDNWETQSSLHLASYVM